MKNRKFERWTEDEYDEVKAMFNDGMTYFEIAEEIGRTKKSVRIKLNKMGCSQSERSKIKDK